MSVINCKGNLSKYTIFLSFNVVFNKAGSSGHHAKSTAEPHTNMSSKWLFTVTQPNVSKGTPHTATSQVTNGK